LPQKLKGRERALALPHLAPVDAIIGNEEQRAIRSSEINIYEG
jgi:hypothetical protein